MNLLNKTQKRNEEVYYSCLDFYIDINFSLSNLSSAQKSLAESCDSFVCAKISRCKQEVHSFI